MSTEYLVRSDLSPFAEMRKILTEELHRSIDEVQDLEVKVETEEITPQDSEWESHRTTGLQQYTLVLADGEKVHFLRNVSTQEVYLGKLPDPPEDTHFDLPLGSLI